jgi:hypothetical protein
LTLPYQLGYFLTLLADVAAFCVGAVERLLDRVHTTICLMDMPQAD